MDAEARLWPGVKPCLQNVLLIPRRKFQVKTGSRLVFVFFLCVGALCSFASFRIHALGTVLHQTCGLLSD